jgi:ABC-type dipeptide/oligopeptide/nickel transport system permease subunit
MRKEYTKKIYDFSPGSWVVLQILPLMVFFLFFLAWDLLSSQFRDVWDEGVSKSINSNEKTALKL